MSEFTASCAQPTAFIATASDAALTASDTAAPTSSFSPINSRLFTTKYWLSELQYWIMGAWAADFPLESNKYIQVHKCTPVERAVKKLSPVFSAPVYFKPD